MYNVIIVCGAPASGKTTYVEAHKGPEDIIVDLDNLCAALSYTQWKERNEVALPFAMVAFRAVVAAIEDREYTYETAWIVSTLPNETDREYLKERLQAELVYIGTPEEECMRRAEKDQNRKDKQLQEEIIRRYFTRLT